MVYIAKTKRTVTVRRGCDRRHHWKSLELRLYCYCYFWGKILYL